MSNARRHLKNTIALLLSGAWAKVFAFATTVLLLKRLSVEDNSIFRLALALGFIFAMVSELGLRGYVLRDLARSHTSLAEAQRIFGNVLNAWLIGTIAIIPIVVIVLWVLRLSSYAAIFTLWLLLYTILDAFALLFKFTLRAYERMEFDAIFSVIGRGGVLLLLFYFVRRHQLTITTATISHITGAACEVLGLLIATRVVTKLQLVYRFDWPGISDALVRSIPFAVVNIVGLIYVRTGTIAISEILGEDKVAYFDAASKLPEALSFFPIAIVNAVLPFLSRNYKDRALTDRYFTFIIRYVGLGGLLVAATFVCDPRLIIRLIAKQEYYKATVAFQWYGVWAFVTFLQYAIMAFLICLNQEKPVMKRYIVSLVVNIILNIALVPIWGVAGAAVALVITETFALVYVWAVLRRMEYHLPVSAIMEMAAFGLALFAAFYVLRALPPIVRLAVIVLAYCVGLAGLAWFQDRALIMRAVTGRKKTQQAELAVPPSPAA